MYIIIIKGEMGYYYLEEVETKEEVLTFLLENDSKSIYKITKEIKLDVI